MLYNKISWRTEITWSVCKGYDYEELAYKDSTGRTWGLLWSLKDNLPSEPEQIFIFPGLTLYDFIQSLSCTKIVIVLPEVFDVMVEQYQTCM